MDNPRVHESSEVRLSRTRTACPRRAAALALLAAATVGLADAGSAVAATPIPTPADAAPAGQADRPPVSLGGGTVRVGPVSIDLPKSVDLPRTVEHVGRTVHRAVRSVGTVVGAGKPPGAPSDPPTGSGPGTDPSSGPGSMSAPTDGSSSVPPRHTSAHTVRRRLAVAGHADSARTDPVGVTPRDQQHPVTTSEQESPRRSSGTPGAGESAPGTLRHITRFASGLFHPSPTVLLLMAFTVALALLVLVMLISVGRRTDPRVAASADRLRSGRSTH